MNRMRSTRRSARVMAVGAVAALALTASATGTALAVQPTQQQVPTYDCDEGVKTFSLVTGFDCTASPGAPRIGVINGPFIVNTPNRSFTCDTGLAAVPVAVLGFGCEGTPPLAD
ncbi:hypothetical protein O7599_05325 [Streptomyces sp. WMMC500]|uniref:hypothetical protein n=1 Tax=Streptomyces sp. WMMC500 TaxID=3015154 RepID=UPI00248ACFAE|nr:hypothetical protein [Streptomyces sp. WMMC500]WBB61966.1 hypothetical protein O7599_05325 [Streptomyces sp. WMMC500]